MKIIAPSILSADFGNLNQDIDMINQSEAQWFHVDVMDGVFVPNISFGFPVMKSLQKRAEKTLDVHLMIVQPERYIEEFAKAGAHILTVHIEASTHLHRSLQQIKAAGMKAGVALNPHTPISSLMDVLEDVDLVCLMSVNPGFGGQKFIPNTLQKIKALKTEIESRGLNTLIEIDGGVTLDNAQSLFNAGADVLVAGNTVFSAENPKATISQLLALSK
ncbi:MAG: ribulose-phosphate 3-epimerase [Bacteroidia bacterium]|nr:ribulose-phosphate 3-epimerase [Bacteroidia bacterium]